jgi:DNA repair protein RadA/Sms
MLLAVLEKRVGFRMGSQDVFLNIAGGIKIDDPAIDLAICVALISSFEDRIVASDSCFAGEVGLGGEIRAVNRIEQRISEAEKLGFKHMFISKFNLKGLDLTKFKIQIHGVSKVAELIHSIL